MTKQLAGSFWNPGSFAPLPALSSLLAKIPPLRPITLLVGRPMNVTYWPGGRPYLSLIKQPDETVLIQLAHKTEVKIIKETARHDYPQMSWESPRAINGVLASGWNKTPDHAVSSSTMLLALKHALDDLISTYSLHDPEGQIIWILPSDLSLLRQLNGGERGLGLSKSFRVLSEDCADQLPDFDDLLVAGEIQPHLNQNELRDQLIPAARVPTTHVITNHRGRPIALAAVTFDAFGDFIGASYWDGSRFVKGDALNKAISDGLVKVIQIAEPIARQLWDLGTSQINQSIEREN